MNKISFIEQFHSLKTELEHHPDINVVICNFNPPATEEELNEARSKFNLTPAMIEFYSQVNGVEIQWERRRQKEISGGGLAAGYINLLPVQEVFGDWKDIIYFEENDPYKPLHPLDFFIEEACVALYLDGSDEPEVYYHYRGEEMSPLGLDFEGYLKLLLKARGFWYWHKVITQSEYVNPYMPMSVEERSFREVMPQLFPDFRESDFKRLKDE